MIAIALQRLLDYLSSIGDPATDQADRALAQAALNTRGRNADAALVIMARVAARHGLDKVAHI